MSHGRLARIAQNIQKSQAEILKDWVQLQVAASSNRPDLIRDSDLREQSREFIDLFARAIADSDGDDINTPAWQPVQELLRELSSARAERGFSPSEIAMFVFSFKQPLFAALRASTDGQTDQFADDTWALTLILDKLGLFTTEVFQRTREEIIARQQQEMLELSTPVVKLWDGILALPMIGTLDSGRTQVVMESLLNRIVETGADIAILDITGVPTVDTLVAQHLIKTVTAARLMGADCIISGIRPQIAQTIVHLGVDLTGVITKASLADAFAVAIRQRGLKMVKVQAKSAAN